MKTLAVSLGLLGALCGLAWAQAPKKERPAPRRESRSALEAPATTPEMWLYEQERQRYEDPRAVVRRNAEIAAAQRARRIESRNWFGHSLSRPIASPNPWYDTYSPGWVSNTHYPYEWAGIGAPMVVYRPGWMTAAY
jgi:hypothetical protein